MIAIYDNYTIFDTRDITAKSDHVINSLMAKEIMTSGVYKETEYQKWAIEEKLGALIDSWYVPLVVAAPEILSKFEETGEDAGIEEKQKCAAC